ASTISTSMTKAAASTWCTSSRKRRSPKCTKGARLAPWEFEASHEQRHSHRSRPGPAGADVVAEEPVYRDQPLLRDRHRNADHRGRHDDRLPEASLSTFAGSIPASAGAHGDASRA